MIYLNFNLHYSNSFAPTNCAKISFVFDFDFDLGVVLIPFVSLAKIKHRVSGVSGDSVIQLVSEWIK